MEILTALKKVIEADAGVDLKRNGSVWLNTVNQDDDRPNVMLMLVGGGQDYSHQGPTGLYSQLVRIYSYGRTAQEAGELGRAISDLLRTYQGTEYGHTVSLCMHTNTNGDYQDDAKVHRQMDDYDVHYRRS